MKRWTIWIAVLLLIALPMSALAVQRGDRGEEVRHVQQLLFDLGYLYDTPDGIFGLRTETALKNYQHAAGLWATGIANDDVIAQLEADWDKQFNPQAYREPPIFCQISVREGSMITEYCAEHTAVLQEAEELSLAGDDTAATQLWMDTVDALYEDWMVRADAQDKLDVLAAQAAWNARLTLQREALEAAYPQDDAYIAYKIQALLKAQVAELCALRTQE